MRPSTGPQPPCGGKRFVEIPRRDQMSFEVGRVEDFVEMLDFSRLEARYPGGGWSVIERLCAAFVPRWGLELPHSHAQKSKGGHSLPLAARRPGTRRRR